MKKLVLLSVFAAAFTFASCGDKKAESTDAVATDSLATEPATEVVADTAATPAAEATADTAVKTEVKTETTTTEVKK